MTVLHNLRPLSARPGLLPVPVQVIKLLSASPLLLNLPFPLSLKEVQWLVSTPPQGDLLSSPVVSLSVCVTMLTLVTRVTKTLLRLAEP